MATTIRAAWRHLRNQPLWTCTALLCLALGTGANTAGLSVVNAFLLRPLPFPDSNRLVGVVLHEQNPPRSSPFSLDRFEVVEQNPAYFTEVSARTFLPVSLKADDSARMVQSELVSTSYFSMLRVTPLIGRFFDPTEPPGPRQAVLSARLWRSRFHADPSILGKIASVNGLPIIIIGIAPPGFSGATQLIAGDLWLPASAYPTLARDSNSKTAPVFGVIARLSPGATREQAQAQLTAIMAATDRNLSIQVEPITGLGFPGAAPAISALPTLLFGLVALVMAVAVANVAALMLAKIPGRRAEIGVKLALGANPAHIAAQVLVESLLLGIGGSALGAAFAWVVTHFMPPLAQLPEHLTYAVDIQPDWRVMLYASLVAVAISVLFGIIPARQAARTDFLEAIRKVGTSRRDASSSRILNILVAGQMAVATVLLVGCGILTKTYLDARGADPGIDPGNTLLVNLDLSQANMDASAGQRFYDRLLDRVRTMSGVTQASVLRDIPLFRPGGAQSSAARLGTTTASVETLVVSPGYFATLRIPLIAGRDFLPTDRTASLVAIVNATMANKYWPGQSAIGQRFEIDGATQPLEVVGIARDIKYSNLAESPRPAFYRPLAQSYSAQADLAIRTSNPEATLSAVRQVIQSENSGLSIVIVRTMREVLDTAIAQRRNGALILGTICGAGLLLSSIGLYGVIAFGVRERTREFGLRMALGAQRGTVLRSVLYKGLRLAGIGFAIGAVLSIGFTRLLGSVLSGLGGQDAVTVAIVGGILSTVATLAAFIPARWATKVDPAIALRND